MTLSQRELIASYTGDSCTGNIHNYLYNLTMAVPGDSLSAV